MFIKYKDLQTLISKIKKEIPRWCFGYICIKIISGQKETVLLLPRICFMPNIC